MLKRIFLILILPIFVYAQWTDPRPRSVQLWHMAEGVIDSLTVSAFYVDTLEAKETTLSEDVGGLVRLNGLASGSNYGAGLFLITNTSYTPDGANIIDLNSGSNQLVRLTEPIVSDTLKLKNLPPIWQVVNLKQFSSGNASGGNEMVYADSMFPENYKGVVFASIVDGKQWISKKFLEERKISVADFGAVGTGTGSDSAAFQNAVNFANHVATNTYGSNVYAPVVDIPIGKYYVNEVTLKQVLLRGEEARAVTIYYGGSGGIGTYMFQADYTGGSLPYYGFQNLVLSGMNEAGTAACENIYKVIGGGIDWGAKFDHCFFANSLGDLIKLKGYVNVFMNHVRFGAAGGWCIFAEAQSGLERRPFSIEDFTWDNFPSSALLTLMQAAGTSDGTNSGKGFISIADSGGLGGVFLSLEQARLEINAPLRNPATVVDLVEIGGDATSPSLLMTNVIGYGQTTNMPTLIRANTERRIRYNLVNVDFDNVLGIEYTSNSYADTQYGFSYGSYLNQISTQGYGLSYVQKIAGKRQSYNTAIPTTGDFTYYQKGDIIWRVRPDSGSTLGWVAVAPDSGLIRADALTVTSASMTSGEDTVRVSLGKALFPGCAITIPGAGAAASDLTGVIVEVVRDVPGYRINKTAGTTVSGVTLSQPSLVWKQFGIAGGVRAASVDTTGSGNTYINDLVQKLKNAGLMQ